MEERLPRNDKKKIIPELHVVYGDKFDINWWLQVRSSGAQKRNCEYLLAMLQRKIIGGSHDIGRHPRSKPILDSMGFLLIE